MFNNIYSLILFNQNNNNSQPRSMQSVQPASAMAPAAKAVDGNTASSSVISSTPILSNWSSVLRVQAAPHASSIDLSSSSQTLSEPPLDPSVIDVHLTASSKPLASSSSSSNKMTKKAWNMRTNLASGGRPTVDSVDSVGWTPVPRHRMFVPTGDMMSNLASRISYAINVGVKEDVSIAVPTKLGKERILRRSKKVIKVFPSRASGNVDSRIAAMASSVDPILLESIKATIAKEAKRDRKLHFSRIFKARRCSRYAWDSLPTKPYVDVVTEGVPVSTSTIPVRKTVAMQIHLKKETEALLKVKGFRSQGVDAFREKRFDDALFYFFLASDVLSELRSSFHSRSRCTCWANIALCCIRMNYYKDAVHFATLAFSEDRTFVQALHIRATAYFYRGMVEEASSDFNSFESASQMPRAPRGRIHSQVLEILSSAFFAEANKLAPSNDSPLPSLPSDPSIMPIHSIDDLYNNFFLNVSCSDLVHLKNISSDGMNAIKCGMYADGYKLFESLTVASYSQRNFRAASRCYSNMALCSFAMGWNDKAVHNCKNSIAFDEDNLIAKDILSCALGRIKEADAVSTSLVSTTTSSVSPASISSSVDLHYIFNSCLSKKLGTYDINVTTVRSVKVDILSSILLVSEADWKEQSAELLRLPLSMGSRKLGPNDDFLCLRDIGCCIDSCLFSLRVSIVGGVDKRFHSDSSSNSQSKRPATFAPSNLDHNSSSAQVCYSLYVHMLFS